MTTALPALRNVGEEPVIAYDIAWYRKLPRGQVSSGTFP